MAYTDFVNNFLDAIDTYRDVCKSHSVFSHFVQVCAEYSLYIVYIAFFSIVKALHAYMSFSKFYQKNVHEMLPN